MRLVLQRQPFRTDYEPFTLYLHDGEIAVRPFFNNAGEASVGWVWTDGSTWSASICMRRTEHVIRRADAALARAAVAPLGGSTR